MSKTYYVIELTARWLTALLVCFALLVAAAFALGYGAAWSVLGGGRPGEPAPAGPPPTPTVTAVVVAPTATPQAVPTVRPSATPAAVTTEPPTPTATPAPPTATPAPPTPTPPAATTGDDRLWVQVLASSRPEAVEEARGRLERLGFPREHQEVVETAVAGGNVLYKVRVGPFPDRDSADRVVLRMQAAGFPDAWVVTP